MSVQSSIQQACEKVTSQYFTDYPDKIDLPGNETGESDCVKAAGLLEMVYDRVDHKPQYNSHSISGPLETLQNEKGNCVEQSVLYASLLKAYGLKARLRAVGNQNGDLHMIAEAGVPGQVEDAKTDLLSFYSNSSSVRCIGISTYSELEIFSYSHEGSVWLPSDPTSSWVTGDITGLVEDGYMEKSSNGYRYVDCEARNV